MCFACAVTNKIAFAQGYFARLGQSDSLSSAHFAAATAAPAMVDNLGIGAFGDPGAVFLGGSDLFHAAAGKAFETSNIARVDAAMIADLGAAALVDTQSPAATGIGQAGVESAVASGVGPEQGVERLDPAALENAAFKGEAGRLLEGLEVDGVGDKLEPIGAQPLLIVDPDDIPDDTSTTVTIDVDGEHIISQLHTIGDQDFVKVELVEGQLYQIGQYAYAGGDGPSGVPLPDAYIELYDASGNLITEADGGGPNTPSGLDALLTYEADYTGTYYINARAYDETPLDGTNGDAVGDYELFVDNVTGLVEGPYYEPEELLYSIDWGGVLVDGTERNPDGDEGTRDTGNEQGDPDTKGVDVTGKNVVKIYFAKAGDVYTPEDPLEPGLPPVAVAVGATDYEYNAVWTALHEFEKVADVVYVETQVREEADFHYVTYTGTPGPGVSLLGSMAPPQESDEGLALFNSNDERWNEEGLAQGGFSFVTLIHEFGHGHGMAHPHDTGGGSDVMDGVEPDGPVASYTLGDYDLNQGVFTMMSYEDGWQTSPYGNAETDAGYGWLGGLMALDIAVIQDKYGVNEDWATGDDVYVMKDVNAAGTFYYSIWDAGGIDMIRYDGAKNSNIDLRAASLKYETGGGGFVSYAHGIYGGFTVANGVTIEKALSGAGNDTITGNEVDNWLSAQDGDDRILARGGDDSVLGGAGNDTLSGGAGQDKILGGLGDDVIDGGAGIDAIDGGDGDDKLYGGGGSDRMLGGEGADRLFGGEGFDALDGGNGDDRLEGEDHDDRLVGGAGGDRLLGGAGNDALDGGSGDDFVWGDDGEDRIIGGEGSDRLFGGAGSDAIDAGDGDDTLMGGSGQDRLLGRAGADRLFGGDAGDAIAGGADNDKLYGEAGNDNLIGEAGNDILFGGDGRDAVNGGSGSDKLFGDAGNDQLVGGGGSDILYGGADRDVVSGGDGHDRLYGDAGNDILFGGDGNDLFVFRDDDGLDTVNDFESGADLIQLVSYREENGGAALTFDQLLVSQDGSDTRIELDLDRDGVADAIDLDGDGDSDSFSVTLLNVNAADITAADFVF